MERDKIEMTTRARWMQPIKVGTQNFESKDSSLQQQQIPNDETYNPSMPSLHGLVADVNAIPDIKKDIKQEYTTIGKNQ